MEMIVAY